MSGLPMQRTKPISQGTLCTTAGPSLEELAHQEPWEQSHLPARTATWGGALKKLISQEPQKHGNLRAQFNPKGYEGLRENPHRPSHPCGGRLGHPAERPGCTLSGSKKV